MTIERNRVFGLDVMRATAILIVVYLHNADLLSQFLPPPPGNLVIDGVDLFFVLSGYLIGGILLKYAAVPGISPWRKLLDFWQRRWLRTLPNYYLFLVINIVLVHFGLANGMLNHNTWIYAFFLQDVWKSVDLFFWESWSLVVEEWYYLIFPLLLFLWLAFLRWPAKRAFLWLTLLLIATSTLLRYWMTAEAASVFELQEGARKLVITRLDTLGIGMLAAWIAIVFPRMWERARLVLLIAGLVGIFLNASAYGDDNLRYSCTAYFTVGALSMAALLPALSSWRTCPAAGRPIVFVSIVSYALYLVHWPMRYLLNPVYARSTPREDLLIFLGYVVLCFFVSWCVYRFWEKPFMDLREKLGIRLGVKAVSSAST